MPHAAPQALRPVIRHAVLAVFILGTLATDALAEAPPGAYRYRIERSGSEIGRQTLTIAKEGDRIAMTHEFLASMLGAHRPSVTLAVQALEQDGLIRRTERGLIVIHDRAALEAASCECYHRNVDELERVFA